MFGRLTIGAERGGEGRGGGAAHAADIRCGGSEILQGARTTAAGVKRRRDGVDGEGASAAGGRRSGRAAIADGERGGGGDRRGEAGGGGWRGWHGMERVPASWGAKWSFVGGRVAGHMGKHGGNDRTGGAEADLMVVGMRA